MELNWLRHPIQTVSRVHGSLIEQAIDANLRCATKFATKGDYEGFHRHCGHAEDLARRHYPERLEEVQRVAVDGVEAVANPPESDVEEQPLPTPNA